MVDSNGELRVFGVGFSSLTDAVGERPLELEKLSKVTEKSPEFRAAIADLREAIRMPDDTAFFCYRAIERIRLAFATPGDGNDKNQSWERLHGALGTEPGQVDDLKEFSKEFATPQRHGEITPMSWDDRLDAMKKAWKIIDQFTVYESKNL